MDMLISLCPALETLTLDDMCDGGKISSSSLLSFCLTKAVVQFRDWKLETPRLKYLKLCGLHIGKIIMNDLSSIVKLDLVGLITFSENYPKFLTLISRVRDLTISSDILAVNRKLSKSIESKDYVILNELFALPRQSMECEVVVRCRTFGTCKPFSLFTCADGFS
ncbi:unnamed protein product [Eruca vesicaria subsp. sativa]|uniref:Uncharacterized protein n=1 Tax=Eruca vesicaria subsp. sativa TaxID=29727 RepID=A0ABC8M621_ERUVS|nr:unnamed protein product [Eruca vesicaria subsp. sativa]